MKRRFWFELTKNIDEANVVWTQLKEESIHHKQVAVFREIKGERNLRHKTETHVATKIDEFQKELFSTKHTAT